MMTKKVKERKKYIKKIVDLTKIKKRKMRMKKFLIINTQKKSIIY